ncbi:MAG: 30S ribosomal protein S13 [Spirochaetes bacterium GWF1_41_5]|nr:MAG: 30S ribosomal protein S13 [Spirochaetes bacterium GWF1_41_5]HBE03503.1 30S ribosomal protein S13 [Spirochaetia bacterium]
MPRISGIDLPNKPVKVALTYIYGIGRSTANKILLNAKVDENIRANNLNEEQVNDIRKIIEKEYTVEGNLRTKIAMDIKRLKDIGSYRGMRHKKNLPARGQRTRTNARTRKGIKKTVANKKMAPAKK